VVWRPAWLERWLERERAKPKGKLDQAIQRQRQLVLRLPKWLVGTSLISSCALGVWCAIYDRGLMKVLRPLYATQPGFAHIATVVFTMVPCMLALYAIARIVKPKPPSNLPDARIR
jgi:hypothetical protein